MLIPLPGKRIRNLAQAASLEVNQRKQFHLDDRCLTFMDMPYMSYLMLYFFLEPWYEKEGNYVFSVECKAIATGRRQRAWE